VVDTTWPEEQNWWVMLRDARSCVANQLLSKVSLRNPLKRIVGYLSDGVSVCNPFWHPVVSKDFAYSRMDRKKAYKIIERLICARPFRAPLAGPQSCRLMPVNGQA
jgi:hypothetical protein